MESTFLIAAIWILLAFLASLISIRLGISLALIEILVGVAAGNVINLQITEWVNFLASLGAVILTFLAGAEIDPVSLVFTAVSLRNACGLLFSRMGLKRLEDYRYRLVYHLGGGCLRRNGGK
jgi:Kef-type K+ transport system membrane component KefB